MSSLVGIVPLFTSSGGGGSGSGSSGGEGFEQGTWYEVMQVRELPCVCVRMCAGCVCMEGTSGVVEDGGRWEEDKAVLAPELGDRNVRAEAAGTLPHPAPRECR